MYITTERRYEDISDIPLQLDHRWLDRYRQLTAYDTYWWWAQAGPFTSEEQQQWEQNIARERDVLIRDQLDRLLVRSRNREITAARSEQREPSFHYPVLAHNIRELHQRIEALHQLKSEILREESHCIVRRLYQDTITEEIDFLHLLETGYTQDDDRYWELTRLLHALPTSEEMEYSFSQVRNILLDGLRYTETVSISQSLIQLIHKQFQLPTFISDEKIAHVLQQTTPLPSADAKQMASPQAVKGFFEAVLRDAGYTGWRVEIDPKAGGASVNPAERRLRIPDDSLTLERIRHLLSHEIAGHVARSIAGERSPLGILAMGTAGYMATEEGLALYNEQRTALLHHEKLDDSGGTSIGMLAVGLACGVITPPQTFTALLPFFEALILLRRLLKRLDKTVDIAQQQARKYAISRCLRTFKGVPNLTTAGVVYTKDVVYQRGLRLVEQAAAHDEAILDLLAMGKIALERLDDLRALQVVVLPQSIRSRAFDPDLDAYILSFEK